jgi:signal transduction histidine kinase
MRIFGTQMTSEPIVSAEIEQLTRELERSRQEVSRQADLRNRAQQEVARLNADLDLRVQERTARLVEINQELVAAEATAKEANKEKWLLLWNMQHELHTPFNAMLGFGKVLASGSPPTTAEQKQQFTAHIVKAGERLLVLIDEVLDLAKIESGT